MYKLSGSYAYVAKFHARMHATNSAFSRFSFQRSPGIRKFADFVIIPYQAYCTCDIVAHYLLATLNQEIAIYLATFGDTPPMSNLPPRPSPG